MRADNIDGGQNGREDEEVTVDRNRARFLSRDGDPFTLLECFRAWMAIKNQSVEEKNKATAGTENPL